MGDEALSHVARESLYRNDVLRELGQLCRHLYARLHMGAGHVVPLYDRRPDYARGLAQIEHYDVGVQ